MKKLFASFLTIAFFGLSQLPVAVAGDGTSKMAARATKMTQHMAEQAKLTEGQYIKVRVLNLRLLTEMTELRRQFAGDVSKLDEAVAETQLRYEWDLANILRPQQMVAYDEMKNSFTAANLR